MTPRQVMYSITPLIAAAALVFLGYSPAFRHAHWILLMVAGLFVLAVLIQIANVLVRGVSKKPDKDSELRL